MVINGRYIGFHMTVLASSEISKLCPKGKLSNIEQLFDNADDAKTFEVSAKLICALNKGYEMKEAFSAGVKPNPITIDEVLSLDVSTFQELLTDAINAIRGERTVEIDEPKKGKAVSEMN